MKRAADGFSVSDRLVYYELARRALADADTFDEMAAELDLTDEEMGRLRSQLDAYMED